MGPRLTKWDRAINWGASLSIGAELGSDTKQEHCLGAPPDGPLELRGQLANDCVEHGPGPVPTIRSQGATPQWGGAGLK